MADTNDSAARDADPRRGLASVSRLLEEPGVQALVGEFSRPTVLAAIQDVLASHRAAMAPGDTPPGTATLVEDVRRLMAESEGDRLRSVVNATGIILHTGLGRAVLPERAVAALGTLHRCCNLQVDLATGLRGKRNFMTEQLLTRLTGAEAAMVVNNNAAATLLILAALCKGRQVVISRGQLIEIGGSYRLPDCVHQSGATLVEVGTTNKTHLRDYARAVSDNTGALMRVNPSNYRIVGFSQDVPIADLVTLGRERSVLAIDDLGCGALVDLSEYGLPHEPTVQESVAAGADIVCFSGDKLVGGPQAGIIVGRKDLVDRIRKHPLTRMLRVGKLTDMALEQTLRLFLDPELLARHHPTLAMLTAAPADLESKAAHIREQVEGGGAALELRVIDGESAVGGGSLPAVPIKTWLLAVRARSMSADALCAALRRHEPPVMARIREGDVLLDMRTLLDGEDAVVATALQRVGAGAEENRV